MKRKSMLVLASVLAAFAVSQLGMSASAHAACKPGYKKVKVQGNTVCAFAGVAGNNKLKAK